MLFVIPGKSGNYRARPGIQDYICVSGVIPAPKGIFMRQDGVASSGRHPGAVGLKWHWRQDFFPYREINPDA